MRYSDQQLAKLIKPMILSTIEAQGDADTKAELLTQAIIKLIQQDRFAHAKSR